MLVTDDCHTEDLLESGHLNPLLKKAVALGLDPLQAIIMVTLNPAEYFRRRDRGAVAPGLKADLVVAADLQEFRVNQVFKDGKLMVEGGRLLAEPPFPEAPVPATAFRVQEFPLEALSPVAAGELVKVIGLVPGQLLTEKRVLPAPIRAGRLVADPSRDLLKLAVVERHRGTGNLGLGLVQGFGLRRGACVSSVAHDSHNIVVVGAEEADMLQAVRHLTAMGGGLAVVADGRVLADLPLPIAGLMSPRPLNEVASAYSRLQAAYRELGGALQDPFMALSFLALPVIPELKLTDLGLVDVGRFEIVPIWGED
jgi:adenine deaminase